MAYLTLMHKGMAGWGVNGLSDSVRAAKERHIHLFLQSITHVQPFIIFQVVLLMTEGVSTRSG